MIDKISIIVTPKKKSLRPYAKILGKASTYLVNTPEIQKEIKTEIKRKFNE